MADSIKDFFKKKKLDIKFKRAGPGHRLDETTPKTEEESEKPSTSRVEPSTEAKQAAAAALARFQSSQTS